MMTSARLPIDRLLCKVSFYCSIDIERTIRIARHVNRKTTIERQRDQETKIAKQRSRKDRKRTIKIIIRNLKE